MITENKKQNQCIKVWITCKVFFWIDMKYLLNQNLFEEPWSNYKYGS